MPKVIAYQSLFDRRVYSFEQRDKYIIHLQKIRQKNTDNRQLAKAFDEFESFRNNAADTLSTIEEIEQWVIDNSNQIINSYRALIFHSNISPKSEILKFSFERIRHDNHVTNSHDAPRDGVTNWCNRYQDRPTGYPGHFGRVHMLIDSHDRYNTSISEILTKLGICTGSGGSGSYYDGYIVSPSQHCLSYEVKLFDSDWPLLAVTEKMNS